MTVLHQEMNLDAPAVAGGVVHSGSLMNGSSWKTMLRTSAQLATHARATNRSFKQGELVGRTLQRLRPCVDAPASSAQFSANATLRHEEWRIYDDVVQQTMKEELLGVSDLLARGLRTNLANPFGTTQHLWETVSEMSAAHVSMYTTTTPEDDRVQYGLKGVPVPVISKGFFLDERVLESSRTLGNSLDGENAREATRVVAEKMEALLFSGGVSYGGYTLGGYTNATGVNTGNVTGAWSTLATTNPGAIYSDVVTILNVLFGTDKANGPFMIYVPRTWYMTLMNPYFTTTAASPGAVTGLVNPNRSIYEQIVSIPQVLDVKPTTQLTTGVVVVSMQASVVDCIYGFEPRLIQWESQGGMGNHFRVMSIMSFRVKADYDGNSGVAYYSVA